MLPSLSANSTCRARWSVWLILILFNAFRGQTEAGGAGLDGVEVLKLLFSLSNMQLGRVSRFGLGSPVYDDGD